MQVDQVLVLDRGEEPVRLLRDPDLLLFQKSHCAAGCPVELCDVRLESLRLDYFEDLIRLTLKKYCRGTCWPS